MCDNKLFESLSKHLEKYLKLARRGDFFAPWQFEKFLAVVKKYGHEEYKHGFDVAASRSRYLELRNKYLEKQIKEYEKPKTKLDQYVEAIERALDETFHRPGGFCLYPQTGKCTCLHDID